MNLLALVVSFTLQTENVRQGGGNISIPFSSTVFFSQKFCLRLDIFLSSFYLSYSTTPQVYYWALLHRYDHITTTASELAKGSQFWNWLFWIWSFSTLKKKKGKNKMLIKFAFETFIATKLSASWCLYWNCCIFKGEERKKQKAINEFILFCFSLKTFAQKFFSEIWRATPEIQSAENICI